MNQGGIHPPPMPTMGAASLPPVVAGASGGPSAEEMTQSLQSMILGAKQQPKPSPAPSPQKSQCQLLNEILQKRNLGLARYAHNASPDGRIFATCTMPWGAKFESRSAAETPDRASEFAAFQALAHLRNNGFPKKGKTPAKDKQQPQSAVAFVPTQVRKREVKSKVEVEVEVRHAEDPLEKAQQERVQNWVESKGSSASQTAGNGTAAKAGNPNRSGSGKKNGEKSTEKSTPGKKEEQKNQGKRKSRLAANFGGANANPGGQE